jgi:hypothetical protein
MVYSRNFITLLKEVVLIIDRDMEIVSATDNGDGTFSLRVCDVKYAQKGYKVTIDDIEYKITYVDFKNKTITISGPSIPTVTFFRLYAPYFFHGTPRETATEVSNPDHANLITPMIFLNETFEEDSTFDDISSVDRVVKPGIYALGQRPEDKFSKDLQEFHVEPMRRLMELLIATAKKQTQLFDLTNYRTSIVNYSKFGVYVTNAGVKKNLFAIPLAGCSNIGDIGIYASDDECCQDDSCHTDSNRMLDEDGSYLLDEEYNFQNQEP